MINLIKENGALLPIDKLYLTNNEKIMAIYDKYNIKRLYTEYGYKLTLWLNRKLQEFKELWPLLSLNGYIIEIKKGE